MCLYESHIHIQTPSDEKHQVLSIATNKALLFSPSHVVGIQDCALINATSSYPLQVIQRTIVPVAVIIFMCVYVCAYVHCHSSKCAGLSVRMQSEALCICTEPVRVHVCRCVCV